MTQEQIEALKRVLRITTMEKTSFSEIAPNDSYPTNEVEADRFIKSRIRLWLETYVRTPIETVLEDENEFQDI